MWKPAISRHGITFWNSWLFDLILLLEYRVAHVSLRTVFQTGSDFRKMKSRARLSSYRVSGSVVFVQGLGLGCLRTGSRARILLKLSSLGLEFSNKGPASRRVSDSTIHHPLYLSKLTFLRLSRLMLLPSTGRLPFLTRRLFVGVLLY